MFRSKKIKKDVFDKEILDTIFHLRKEWSYLEGILDRSVEPSESGQFDLAVTKAKYFYLIREAKIRNLSAIK
ncbi:YaaL family protein [Gracilibacillus massiliensis]|uniref:YaaL family protein n=1 Tax=Gracilibacillus massiliensis TaxID=1564956 RepID=UPI00071D679D|nr:YaaL family protein [Gracilibacillus massiliensis]